MVCYQPATFQDKNTNSEHDVILSQQRQPRFPIQHRLHHSYDSQRYLLHSYKGILGISV